jgi:hypothetical protein
MSSKLLRLCKKIIKYTDKGCPAKDAIEMSDYTADELIVELANHYVAANDSGL